MSRAHHWEGTLWKYQGKAAWYFLTLPKKLSKEIKEADTKRPGWGSIRVGVTIGKTSWDTSIFPSNEIGYVLPVKAAVRKKEAIDEGDTVKVKMQIKGAK